MSENNEELWDYEDLQGLDATEILEVINDLIDTIDTTPDYWAESVKMADDMGDKITYNDGKYIIWNIGYELGPFTLPELHEKLISLRESEGE